MKLDSERTSKWTDITELLRVEMKKQSQTWLGCSELQVFSIIPEALSDEGGGGGKANSCCEVWGDSSSDRRKGIREEATGASSSLSGELMD